MPVAARQTLRKLSRKYLQHNNRKLKSENGFHGSEEKMEMRIVMKMPRQGASFSCIIATSVTTNADGPNKTEPPLGQSVVIFGHERIVKMLAFASF
jgi:hypothetical protein